MPAKRPRKKALRESKNREHKWKRIEFKGKVGFLPFTEKRVLKQKLEPVLDKIAILVKTGDNSLARRYATPVLAKLAAKYALMAIPIKSRKARQAAYTRVDRIVRRDADKGDINFENADAAYLAKILGGEKNAIQFLRSFIENYEDLALAANEIVSEEIGKERVK
ncbi:MAG: hypothetical protein JW772_02180 [Candidatus Diapherotrites archaeon]|nr:hypothetical protein [Candidatus Diapherotrites archaeon]